jgi:nucleoside-diphosphate-sugar epimerase
MTAKSTSSLVVLGATGFLGKNLLGVGHLPLPLKAVSRKIPPDADLTQKGVTWFAADLLSSKSLSGVLESGDIVVNLAYLSGTQSANVRLIDNVIQECFHSRVSRLIHCSTATVVGATHTTCVDESTPCEPTKPYEQAKLNLERRVLSAGRGGLDVGIVRPTAIVGPGGKNLAKLAHDLRRRRHMVNYLRACLFGTRPMHLVPVETVAAALLYLALLPEPLNGNIYMVSSDDDPDNNFARIEELLSLALGLEPRRMPLLPVPRVALRLMLRILGRSETNTSRVYDGGKLRTVGFEQIHSVANAVSRFGTTLQSYHP